MVTASLEFTKNAQCIYVARFERDDLVYSDYTCDVTNLLRHMHPVLRLGWVGTVVHCVKRDDELSTHMEESLPLYEHEMRVGDTEIEVPSGVAW